MNGILWAFVVLLAAKTAFQLFLEALNAREVRRHAVGVPEAVRGVMDEPTYRRSVAYTLAHNHFDRFEIVYGAGWLALFVLSGFLPWAWSVGNGALGDGVWAEALIFFLITVVMGLPDLPLSYYQQFVLEQRFEFNKMTPALWVSDRLKGLVLGAALGVPLLALILWLVRVVPLWWLAGFAILVAFQLLMVVLYPMLILPLFNKLTALPDGELKDRLFALARRTSFQARTIQVMDGSKRSAHSNAFFTGFGRFRRIVLFDTLLKQLGLAELEAVLAHEIGHYQRGHIWKTLAISSLLTLGGFAVVGWLATEPWFVEAFGFTYRAGHAAPALLMFSLLGGLVTFWFAPLSNLLSRKHEYEADAFARQAMGGDPGPLSRALRTLSEKNLSNLTPHPLYSGFYYSHPTLVEREHALARRT